MLVCKLSELCDVSKMLYIFDYLPLPFDDGMVPVRQTLLVESNTSVTFRSADGTGGLDAQASRYDQRRVLIVRGFVRAFGEIQNH